MYKIVNDFPNEILNVKKAPFISLYQPTHRHKPEKRQDLIRFNNLIQEIQNVLAQEYSKQEIEDIMKPFYSLKEDRIFWNHTLDGLAILAADNKCVVYKLQGPVKELAVVSDSFHIKPLIRIFQSADRYHLLGLNRNEFTLYEGNRYGFEEIEIEAGIPTTLKEVVGDDYAKPALTTGTYGGVGGAGTFHGHGSRRDEIDKDTEKFFRYVDRFVLDNFSRPTGLPLILVALTEYHTLFQDLSHNPNLLDQGIRTAYDALSMDQLRASVWEEIEPLYLEKTKSLIDNYQMSRSRFLGSDDLAQIARAGIENNIATLMIEADRIIPGKIKEDTGKIIRGGLKDLDSDDILDDLAEIVFRNRGEVIVLPKERMPTDTGAAAVYRY